MQIRRKQYEDRTSSRRIHGSGLLDQQRLTLSALSFKAGLYNGVIHPVLKVAPESRLL